MTSRSHRADGALEDRRGVNHSSARESFPPSPRPRDTKAGRVRSRCSKVRAVAALRSSTHSLRRGVGQRFRISRLIYRHRRVQTTFPRRGLGSKLPERPLRTAHYADAPRARAGVRPCRQTVAEGSSQASEGYGATANAQAALWSPRHPSSSRQRPKTLRYLGLSSTSLTTASQTASSPDPRIRILASRTWEGPLGLPRESSRRHDSTTTSCGR